MLNTTEPVLQYLHQKLAQIKVSDKKLPIKLMQETESVTYLGYSIVDSEDILQHIAETIENFFEKITDSAPVTMPTSKPVILPPLMFHVEVPAMFKAARTKKRRILESAGFFAESSAGDHFTELKRACVPS